MIIILDTSTPLARLMFVDEGKTETVEWQADRTLAKGLLQWLEVQLAERDKTWKDVEGLAVFRGPGSFTGLRIGITVMNTLAESLQVAIVGGEGDDWQQVAQQRLARGEDDKLVLPHYDRDATITTQRK